MSTRNVKTQKYKRKVMGYKNHHFLLDQKDTEHYLQEIRCITLLTKIAHGFPVSSTFCQTRSAASLISSIIFITSTAPPEILRAMSTCGLRACNELLSSLLKQVVSVQCLSLNKLISVAIVYIQRFQNC